MTLTLEPQTIPLRVDSHGVWRVGETRVLLSIVIQAFNAGRTPEEIVQSYDTLKLGEVYSVIAYYLAHRNEVNAAIKEEETQAESVMATIHSREDVQALRTRLLERKADYNISQK